MSFHTSTTFGQLPEVAAIRFGSREALLFEGRRFTFEEFNHEVEHAAAGLIHSGIKAGEHVSLWLQNSADWMVLSYAIARIGAVQVPINTRFRSHDLDYVLRQSDSTTLITHSTAAGINYLEMVRSVIALPAEGSDIVDPSFPELKRVIILDDNAHPGTLCWKNLLNEAPDAAFKEIGERQSHIDVEDPVLIMYTSGTTGFPKGVMHNHGLLRNVEERGYRMGVSTNDTILNYLPMFHAFGFSEGVLMSLVMGARQIVTEGFVPDEALNIIEAEGVSIIHGFEAHAKGLSDSQEANPRNLITLRTGIFAAGMMSATPVARKAVETLKPLAPVSGFGMTELWLGVALGSLDETTEHRTETSGYPGIGYRVRVQDLETKKLCPSGEPGELQVQGEFLMMGYYKKPKETAEAYTEDGWFKTGDMAVWRDDGYVRFLGRYKDMLKVGGENVDPMEVEGLLLSHPAIHQTAVVGYPDARLSEVAVAFVQRVPQAALSAEEVIEFCRDKVASFKRPKHVIFVDEFPMTASGKIRKVELRERALQALG